MGKITYNKQKEIIKADSEIFSRIGFEKNYFFISKDKSKVTYSALGKTYNFRDPEEKVRIEYYFDLLEKYNYPIMRIELEVEMPSRTPQYYADIVIYENDDKKIPYIVVECKKDGISDAEFEQAVKQAIANDRVLKAPFAICVAGNTRRAIETEMWNDKEAEKYRFWHDFAQNNLFGIEINDSIARVAKMNMIIHDDGHTNVIGFDALENIEKMREKNRGFAKNCFDIIVTNPPFGANVKRSEHPYLEKFALGRKKDKKGKERALDNQKTEILFIERCIEFLKVGTGKMAIVLPDGILTNSSLQPVRDFLMERCRILAVVSLPQFAFTHFGAGVKSSLVFVRKKSESEESGRYPIFMAIAEHIGYDATGRKDAKNDLDEIYEEFKKFKGKNNL